MIQRNYYLNRLIRNMWNGEIKVITGIRRCGKSVLLFELFDEYLRNHGTDATQIIKIELDQRRYYKYRNPITLCEYVEQLVLGQQDKKLYLFIDEVQLTAKVIDQENGGIEVTIYDMLNELAALYYWGAPTADGTGRKKIGRNDPCPCGSGKKFKKCCGR